MKTGKDFRLNPAWVDAPYGFGLIRDGQFVEGSDWQRFSSPEAKPEQLIPQFIVTYDDGTEEFHHGGPVDNWAIKRFREEIEKLELKRLKDAKKRLRAELTLTT